MLERSAQRRAKDALVNVAERLDGLADQALREVLSRDIAADSDRLAAWSDERRCSVAARTVRLDLVDDLLRLLLVEV